MYILRAGDTVDECLGANLSTTLCGSMKMARPQGLNSEDRRAKRSGVLGDGMFLSVILGERCKLPQWGRLKHR